MTQNSFEKVLIYIIKGGIFTILFLPLLITDSLYFPYITGKNFVFRIIIEIIFFLYLILIVGNKKYRPKFSILLTLISLFILANFISTILSPSPYHSFWGNYERMIGFLGYLHLFLFFLIIISIFKTEKEWIWLFKTSILVSLLTCLYALAQKFSLFGLNNPQRLDSTFGNPLYLGVFIILNIFFILYFLIKSDNWQKLIGWSTLFLFEIYILLNTFSRGSELGLIGGLFLFLFLILITKRNQKSFEPEKQKSLIPPKLLKIISLILLVLIFLSSITIIVFRNSNFVQNLPYLQRLTKSLKSSLFQEARFVIWGMTLEGIKEKPIFGWGPESFFYLYNKHYNPKMYKSKVFFDRAHNMILDISVESGIVGLSFYILIFLFSFYVILKLIRKKQKNSLFYIAILTTLFAYSIQNLTLFDNLTSFVLFFIILGYLNFENQNKQENQPQQKINPKFKDYLSKQITTFIILSIPLIFLIYFLNIKPLLAAYYTVSAYKAPNINEGFYLFKKAINLKTFGNYEIAVAANKYFFQIFQNGAGDQQTLKIKNEFENFLIKTLTENSKNNPKDFKNLLALSEIYGYKKEYKKSLEILDKILKLSPKQQRTYNKIAETYIKQSKYDKAIDTLKSAIKIQPLNKQTRFILIIAYLKKSDLDLAKKEFKEIQKITNLEIEQAEDKEKKKIALKLRENDLNELAKIYNNSNYPDLAEETLKEIIKINPKNINAYLDLSNIYIAKKQNQKVFETFNKLIPLLKEAIEKSPKISKNYFALAYIYSQTKQKQKALEILKKLYKQDPSQKIKIMQFIKQFQLIK